MKKFILSIALVIGTSVIYTQSKIHFEKSIALTPARNLALQGKKPIFIYFYADWNGPCKWMERNVFNDGGVTSYVNEHFINLKANTDLGGKALATEFQVHALPAYVFIDSMGGIILKQSGSMEKDIFLNLAQQAVQRMDKTWSRYETRYTSGDRNPDFLMSYYDYLNAIHHPERFAIAAEYIKTQKDWDTAENLSFILYRCNAVNDDKIYKFLVQHKNLFYAQFKEPPVDSVIRLGIYLKLAGLPEDELVAQLNKEYHKVFPNKKDQYVCEYKLNTLWNGVTEHRVKIDSFSRAMQHYFTRFPRGDWTLLRDMALRVCLTSDQAPLLMQSLKWASKALRSNSNDWLNNYTMAALFYRLGNHLSAKTFIDKAKEVAGKDLNANTDMIDELWAVIDGGEKK